MEFPVFWFPLTASSPLAGHYWGGSDLSLQPSGIYRHCSDIIELSLLHAEQSQLSQLLSVRCFNPLIIFAALHWACSRTSGSAFSWHAQEWAQHSKCGLTSLRYKGQTPRFVANAPPHAATSTTCPGDWGEADYWPAVLHTHPSWRLGWYSLPSSSQEPPLITRSLKDNCEYPYHDICHFLSILRSTLLNPTDWCMSSLAPNFTSLTSSPWFVNIRVSKEPVLP